MDRKKNKKQQAIVSTFCGADTRGCPVERVSELIRIRAYQLYENRGHQPGRELDDWLQAERETKQHLGIQ